MPPAGHPRRDSTCLLRHREDRRSLLFVALACAALVLPYGLPQIAHHPALLVLWVLLSGFLCFIASIVTHNHMHHAIFHSRTGNRVFNLILSICRGHTASGIIVPHHFNHHRESGGPRDWIRPQLSGTGRGWIRLCRFIVLASLNMLRERQGPEVPRLGRRAEQSRRCEQGVLAMFILWGLWMNWPVFLLFNGLPWLLGLAMLVGVNLLQHDGCVPDQNIGASRDFVGRLGNWFCLNNGYHTAHHVSPATHWTRLPALHATFADEIRARGLEQPSLLVFLWRFGVSGKRSAPSAKNENQVML